MMMIGATSWRTDSSTRHWSVEQRTSMQPVFTFDTFDEDDDDGDDDDDKVRTMMIVMMMMMMITMMMMMMMMMNIMMVMVIPGSYKCCNYLELCLGRCSFAPCTHTSTMMTISAKIKMIKLMTMMILMTTMMMTKITGCEILRSP